MLDGKPIATSAQCMQAAFVECRKLAEYSDTVLSYTLAACQMMCACQPLTHANKDVNHATGDHTFASLEDVTD